MQADAMQALSYAYLAFPYVVALLLGLLVPALGVLCYSSFGSGVAVIVGMFAVEALYMFVGGFSVGVSLFYTDLTLAFASHATSKICEVEDLDVHTSKPNALRSGTDLSRPWR